MSSPEQNPVSVLRKALKYFKVTSGEQVVKPHMLITGVSGGGKSHSVKTICEELGLNLVQINTPLIVKKNLCVDAMLQALIAKPNEHWVIFIDEFDKQLLDPTNGTMIPELLTLIETGNIALGPDFGSYCQDKITNMLFLFGGAFDNKEISYYELLSMGVPREFLGRVTQHIHLPEPNKEDIINSIDTNKEFLNATSIHYQIVENKAKKKNITLNKTIDDLRNQIKSTIVDFIENNDNPLGYRIIAKVTYDTLLGSTQKENKNVYKRSRTKTTIGG